MVPDVGTQPPGAVPATERFVPGVAAARTYQRAWLSSDIVAGLVLTALLVPQGMAYAELAGLAGDHRPVHVDHVPARLRRVRPVADPRARSGLVARPDDRRDDPPVGRRGRRSGQGDRPRLHARPAGRRLHGGRGDRPAGLRRRPVLQAHPDRLHERPGPHDPRGPAPEALRVLHRRRLVPRGADAASCRGWPTGRRFPRPWPSAWRVWPSSWGSEGSRPRSPECWPPSSRPSRRSSCSTSAARASRWSASCPRASPRSPCREWGSRDLALLVGRRPRHHAGVAHRHDLDVIGVRRSHRPGGRRQPGDDRHRHRQPRRRAVPGLPREHERVADRGGGAGGGQDPADRGDRRR